MTIDPLAAPAAVACIKQAGCPACAQFGPVFTAVASQVQGVVMAQLDISAGGASEEVAARYRVDMLPTVLFLRHGLLLGRITGAVDEVTLQQALQTYFPAELSGPPA